MRVLHILAELKPSGAELMLHAAATYWRRRGIEGEILCTGESMGALAAVLESDGFRIHHLPFARSWRHVLHVYRFLRVNKYDAVHIHTERASFWYGLAAYSSRKTRIFRTVHNNFPFRGWLGLKRYCGRMLLARLGVKTISVSPSVCATELQYFHNRSVVVFNWFDDTRYVPPTPTQQLQMRARLSLAPDTFVLASLAGVCTQVKNHAAILEALAALPRSCNILYLHIGAEDEQRTEFELAKRLHIIERVRFCGMTEDPVSLLHAADAYVMPSLHEGLSCAAIEAMGAGLPVIFSRVAGLADFAETCPDIVWVQPTPESIAKGITALLEITPEQRRKVGAQLAQCAHRNFSAERGSSRYAELYDAKCNASATAIVN
jgi:glycosyltransferase involved in cell wall biosynthesis